MRILKIICIELAIVFIAGAIGSTTVPPVAKYGHHGAVLLPDPLVTPGIVRTTDSKEICAADFRTGPFRGTPPRGKVYREYGVKPNTGICKGGCEVDHLIPLELGGLDDIKDLWPQPSQPKPGFHEKDLLENYLHKEVCGGKMALVDAQAVIRTDWYAAYLEMLKDTK
jgi:hypothetical protein